MDDVLGNRGALPGDPRLSVQLNPDTVGADRHREYLATCFGRPWSRAEYDWYFTRKLASRAPDRVMLMRGDEVVAGCGLAYRTLRLPDGSSHEISIILGAATSPAARSKGYYQRLLPVVRARSAAAGCSAILGFVTAENSSGRGLTALGAARIPSYYLSSAGRPTKHRSRLTVASCRPARRSAVATNRYDHRQRPAVVMLYASDSEWRSQICERPGPTQRIQLGCTADAVVETVNGVDRLQWLRVAPWEFSSAVRTIADRAQRNGRDFFMYTTSEAAREEAQRCGLRARRGFVMVLAAEPSLESTVRAWAALPWRLQSGDRL